MKFPLTLTLAAVLAAGAVAPALAQAQDPEHTNADRRSDNREQRDAVNAANFRRNHDRAIAAEGRTDAHEVQYRQTTAAAAARRNAANRAQRDRTNAMWRARNHARAEAADQQGDIRQAERRGDPTHVPQR